ncbi:MAG: argininosuccinate synthase [Candidatus Diapherotrites archaeon]
MGEKVVLAYSGGLDTSVIVKWLDNKGYDVICASVDLGQEMEKGIKEKALASGAKKFFLIDAKKEFVEDGVFQCLKANAKYEGKYLMGTSIARPFISKKLVEVAKEEGTNIIAHGATGKGNDQCRFELTAAALMPDVKIIAPWRDKGFRELIPGRIEAIDFAKKNGIPVSATKEKPWSNDDNIAHKSSEAGMLEDPMAKPLEDMYTLTSHPKFVGEESGEITISFKDGIPVALNGKKMGGVELLTELNSIGKKHGIGILDMVENRFVGIKSRGVYEAPGVTILYIAHNDLEGICMDRDLMHLRDSLIPEYAKLVYNGFWCGREFHALNKLVDASQIGVSGEVKLELYKGNCIPVGRSSEFSLYDESISTMEKGGDFNQDDSTGFLKINSLPLKIQSKINKKLGIELI